MTQEPLLDPAEVIAASRCNVSNKPVTTARYTIDLVMNEEDVDATPEQHRKRLSDEIQLMMDGAKFTEELRYDTVIFRVVHREVLDVAPANCPDPQEG